MKKEQAFHNHARYVPGFHFVTLPGVLAVFIASLVNLFTCGKENLFAACLFVLIAVVLAGFSWYFRTFALKAQDRAIRAEESLRYFVLTGKPLPASLRMGQIIALRFASDEEFPGLVAQTLAENLRNRQIKQQIRNWRADHYRA